MLPETDLFLFNNQTEESNPDSLSGKKQVHLNVTVLAVNYLKVQVQIHEKTHVHFACVCTHAIHAVKHTSRVSKSDVPFCKRFNLILHVSLRNIKLFRFCLITMSGEKRNESYKSPANSDQNGNIFHSSVTFKWVTGTETSTDM